MFKKYHFPTFINKAIKDLGFFKPTQIQEEIIPLIQKGVNTIGKSQTGTGKTHAFLLPILANLEPSEEVDLLIILPTRELAMQIFEEINKVLRFSLENYDVRLYVGGSNRPQEMERLEKTQPQIVVGTLGKIKDLAITSNLLKIHTAKTIVIDEADMVFEASEANDLDDVFRCFQENAQYLVFSATIPQDLMVFLNKYLKKFEIVDQVSKQISKEAIEHIFIPTKNNDKNELLLELLETFHPYLALIFANTKTKVDELAQFLGESGLLVGKISGDMEARERKQILRRIKDGFYQYVVATDLAARGLDITGVSHVINFELPVDLDFYVHRTGRTGRADFTGTALSFYDYDDDVYLEKLKAKGLDCSYRIIKDGELLPYKREKPRVKKENEEIEKIHNKYPLSKKVKPGYKKKRKQKIEKEVRKLKRAYIDEIYRRKARKKED